MKVLWLLGLICTFVAIGATTASAGVVTWKGGSSYNQWTVAANWNGGVLPTAGDTAVLGTDAPSMNGTLSPAPDVIRIDPGCHANATGSFSNNLVLNGGIIDMSGDNNPTMSGTIQLTADSTIQNTRGNSNRGFKVNGVISEDGTPRKLTLSGYPTLGGVLLDSTSIGGANIYSGGTDVRGASNSLKNLGALGTGPVNVYGGRLIFGTAGNYTHGTVTVTGGSVVVGVNGVANENWDFQGGTLTYDQQFGRTLDATNHVTIENMVNIAATGSYYNNAFIINAGISGTGKAVLNDNGTTTSSDIVQFGATQQWTGGTDVKGIVELISGRSLPGGVLTVYPVTPGSGAGLLRIDGASGLSTATDLVLQYDSGANKYGTLMIGGNQTVHSLTLNGVVQPAGVYTMAMLPNYLVGSDGYTLTVTAPEPATLTLLALAGAGLVARRRR